MRSRRSPSSLWLTLSTSAISCVGVPHRHGLRALFDPVPDLDVVAEASDGAEAVERVTAGGIHLAVLDIAMPRMTGLQAAYEITRRAPEVRTLMLSMYDDGSTSSRRCERAPTATSSNRPPTAT